MQQIRLDRCTNRIEASIDALEIAITIEYLTQVIRIRDRLIETLRDRLIETTGLLDHREVTIT